MIASTCGYCDDGEGHCVFPFYGVGPHRHVVVDSLIGSTVNLPPAEWPSNYTEDQDCPGLGVYTHCPHCGAGQYPGENT